jgi:hypothetical protein
VGTAVAILAFSHHFMATDSNIHRDFIVTLMAGFMGLIEGRYDAKG